MRRRRRKLHGTGFGVEHVLLAWWAVRVQCFVRVRVTRVVVTWWRGLLHVIVNASPPRQHAFLLLFPSPPSPSRRRRSRPRPGIFFSVASHCLLGFFTHRPRSCLHIGSHSQYQSSSAPLAASERET